MDGINRYFEPNTLDGLNQFDVKESLYIDGTNAMIADADMGGHNVKNVATATAADEAVNLGQLQSTDALVVHKAGSETITGVKTFDGATFINGTMTRGSNSFTAKQHVKSEIYPSLLANITIPAGSNWTPIATIPFSRSSSRARLFITVDINYYVGGSATDRIISRLVYDASPVGGGQSVICSKIQYWDDANGGGTRSSTIFPLCGSYLMVESTVNIIIEVYTVNCNDNVTFFNNSGFPGTYPGVTICKIDEYFEP
jgi:hypothetical protein